VNDPESSKASGPANNEGLEGNASSDAPMLARIGRALAALGAEPKHRGV
jgi:hypothetical protein